MADGCGCPPKAITLGLRRFDEQAFWEALIEIVPDAFKAPDEETGQSVIRGWINGTGLRVFYLPVGLECYGRDLPKIIRGAQATLDDFGDFAPGTRVLVIIACLRNADKTPFWWPWYARFMLAGLRYCHRLKAMRLLNKTDIAGWHAGFPKPFLALYDRDRLMAELLKLFPPDDSGIRYEQARRYLIDEGALQRVRRKPCP